MQVFDREVECVVLDIDDTLYLERDYVRSGFDAVGTWVQAELNIEGFGERAFWHFREGIRGDTFNRVLFELGAAPSQGLVERLVDVYRNHVPNIVLEPDAAAFIQSLVGQIHLAVVTDGPLASQQGKAHALGLPASIRHIVYTATLGRGLSKPHPAAFERVQQLTGCSGPQCMYIADNPSKDFVAPFALGWHTIRINRVGSLHESRPSGPDVNATFAGFPSRFL